MPKHVTTPSFIELASAGGTKNPSVTPGASQQSVTFLLNGLKVGKDATLFNYVTAICVEARFDVDQPDSNGAAINADQLHQAIASYQLQCPLLGTVMQHSNNRGTLVGNIDQYVGGGFNATPLRAQIASTDGDNFVTLYHRIPVALDFLANPMDTAIWTGFLEGGQFEIKFAASTVLGSSSALETATFRVWLEVQPEPEARIHVPFHWREHQTPGGSTKHVILDMGASDGLNGTDTGKGVGIAALYYLCDRLGFGGADGADNIISYDIPWRNQDRIDSVSAPFLALMNQIGSSRRLRYAASNDWVGFPYTLATTVAATPTAVSNGGLNDAEAMIYPLIHPGCSLKTSKLQTVAGAREINIGYTSTPSSAAIFRGLYMPQFSEQFAAQLAQRMAPGKTIELVAKTINKNVTAMLPGTGKLAYTPLKLKVT